MRLLRNRKTGIVRPWNAYLARHPDMHDYEEAVDGPAKVAPKKPERVRAAKEAKAKSAPPKKALPTGNDAELDDLMAGIENGAAAQ